MFLVVFALLFLVGHGLAENKIVCYYGSWSNYRNDLGKFHIEDLQDPTLCTHVMYAFAGLDPNTFEIKVLDPYLDLAENWGLGNYDRTVALKNKNPELKVMLSAGGWNEGSISYSNMASDPAKRSTFINSVVVLLGEHGFDGFDLDWEYPGDRGGASTDKENYVILLRELKEALQRHNWLLSIAVGMGYNTVMTSYSIPDVAANVDFINMMTYDFFGAFDGITDHHTRLYHDPGQDGVERYYNLHDSVNLWIDGGAPPEKLVLGMAAYGRTYTVPVNEIGPIGVASNNPGTAGQYTRERGFIGYYEMCMNLLEGGWTIETDDYVRAPWAYKVDQWIAYDIVSSLIEKSNWGMGLGLGGGMVWSIETDDFRNLCGDGTFPLLKAMNSVWRSGWVPATTLTPPTQTTTTTIAAGNSTTTTTTQDPNVTPGGSCVLGTYKPDPTDCTKYYQCTILVDGSTEWISRTCLDGLYFNPELDVCDYPYNVDCTPVKYSRKNMNNYHYNSKH